MRQTAITQRILAESSVESPRNRVIKSEDEVRLTQGVPQARLRYTVLVVLLYLNEKLGCFGALLLSTISPHAGAYFICFSPLVITASLYTASWEN